MSHIQSLTTQLMSIYCPALEESTLLAILSDFDLANPSQLKAVRNILDDLQKTAKEEEETGFDASGSSGADALFPNGSENGRGDNDSGSGSGRSVPGWSSSTDDSSLAHGMTSLDIDGLSESDVTGEDATYGTELETLNQDTKESMLVEMFPGLKPFDVKWTLKKCGWDVTKAINELMTHTFMEENGTRRRGVDAFSETDLPSQTRKGRGNRKRGRTGAVDDLSIPVSPEVSSVSKWDTGKQDVEFISTRTGRSAKEIASLYHKNGASIRATILTILEAQDAKNIKPDDPLMESTAIDLGHEFPTFPSHLLEPLIQITHPSTSRAHELAKAFVFKPTSNIPNIQLEFRHAPIEPEPAPSKPKSSNTVHQGLSLDTATVLTSKYTKEREIAFTKARAAYRKGKSDHLMGGAAAYYSELGRTADSRLKSAQSASADALVASQSSKTQLDLHGVSVQDAKRITSERVTTWWHELGESRMGGRGVAAEYKIVTGVGYHSEGGRSKLAPAILKMLMNDGWKVQVGTGSLVVKGIAKRK